MIPIDQTIFGNAGNCLSAAVASICHLPLSGVPDLRGGGWWPVLAAWTQGFGWAPLYFDTLPLSFTGYCVGLGDGPPREADLRRVGEQPRVADLRRGGSQRGRKHAVVWWGGPQGGIAHDPHPSRGGLTAWPEGYVVFTSLDVGGMLVG